GANGGLDWVRYMASLDASLIAVDTGQRLAVFSVTQSAFDSTAPRALRTALQRAGRELAKQMLEKTDRPTQRVELWVKALPAASLDGVSKALSTIAGV